MTKNIFKSAKKIFHKVCNIQGVAQQHRQNHLTRFLI